MPPAFVSRYSVRQAKAGGIGAAMALDHDPGEPQQAGSIVANGIEFALEAPQRRPGQHPHQPTAPVGLEGRLHPLHQQSCQTFAGLEHRVADEAVADHHVGGTAEDPVALDIAEVGDPGILPQPGIRLADAAGTLRALDADVEQRHPRRDQAVHMARHELAHQGEVDQASGTRLDVGAQVEQIAAPPIASGNGGADRRPRDARHRAQGTPRQGHQGAGVTGTDPGQGVTGGETIEHPGHAGIGAVAQRLAGALRLADHTGRITDLQTRRRRGQRPRQAGDLVAEPLGGTEQLELEIRVGADRLGGPHDDWAGTEVPAHRVDGDPHVSGQPLPLAPSSS